MSDYFDWRRDMLYYKYIRTLLGLLSYNARSICDVGSNGVDIISWLPCWKKVSIDLKKPFSGNGVEGITADFITYNFSRKFDIVTCFQVMEHIDDEHIHVFANSLLSLTNSFLIVSVPYMWSKGNCKEHLQDPIDEKKFLGWFNTPPPEASLKPVFSQIINDGHFGRRMVVVFAPGDMVDIMDSLNNADSWLLRY